MIRIALADDHVVMRNGLAGLLKGLGYDVVLEADDGEEFIRKIKEQSLPDIALLDINMPNMDGYETALWIKTNCPEVKVLALSMYDDEASIIRMLKNGARGYLLKDSDLKEVKLAIDSIVTKNYYHSELVSNKLMHSMNHFDDKDQSVVSNLLNLTDREIEVMKMFCKELVYKEIAQQMNLSPRTVEGYRDTLCERLNVKGRIGLVLYAIKNGIVKM